VIALAVYGNLTAMSYKEPQQSSFDTQWREPSMFILPEYEIFYGADHTLEWSPPVGSKELAFALSCRCPLRDLESKMRAATRRFIKAQKVNASGKNLDTGDENNSVSGARKVAATSDVRPPHGEPRRSSATRSIIDSEDLMKNSTDPARRHPQFIIEEEAPRNFTSRLKDRRHIIFPTYRLREKVHPQCHRVSRYFLWNPELQIVKKKRKTRRYEKGEAAQVTANRGGEEVCLEGLLQEKNEGKYYILILPHEYHADRHSVKPRNIFITDRMLKADRAQRQVLQQLKPRITLQTVDLTSQKLNKVYLSHPRTVSPRPLSRAPFTEKVNRGEV
jgi:hypothetical protein